LNKIFANLYYRLYKYFIVIIHGFQTKMNIKILKKKKRIVEKKT